MKAEATRSEALSGASAPRPAVYPDGVDWAIEVPDHRLERLLSDAAERFAERPCLEFLGRSWSYHQVWQDVLSLAAGLQRLGVTGGVQVGLYMPNTPYFVVAFFGILAAGGTAVNYSPLLSRKELAHQIADSETRILITVDHPRFLHKAHGCVGEDGLERLIVCPLGDVLPIAPKLALLAKQLFERKPSDEYALIPWQDVLHQERPAAAPEAPPADAHPAVLQYTSGTMGVPKGVVLTHRNLMANALQLARWFTTAEPGAERFLALLPFTHAFGLSGIMTLGLRLGAELVILPRFEAGLMRTTIERRRPTLMAAVPALFRAMLKAPRLANADLSSFKAFVCGGDALPQDLQRDIEQRFGRPIAQGYGLTECAPVVTCGNPLARAGAQTADRPGSAGLPLPGTRLRIVSTDDGGADMPTGSAGEVWVSGPQVSPGYWRQPEASRAAFADGFLRTADIGYLDADGFLHIVDRLKEVIVTKGFNVYPSVVERAIQQHPDVADVSVIGMPDAERGEVVTAVVVLEPERTLTLSELRDFLSETLSQTELPRSLVLREDLPKSPLGKTLKRRLKQQLLHQGDKPPERKPSPEKTQRSLLDWLKDRFVR